MSALFSFLGSAAFRWLMGEVMGMVKAREERNAEIAMLQLQHNLDREREEWRRQSVKEAAEQGVKLVEAQSVAAQSQADAMMLEAIRQIGVPSGIKWLDAWNGGIRPFLATVSILVLVGSVLFPAHVVITGLFGEIVAGVLGLYVGGRVHVTGR